MNTKDTTAFINKEQYGNKKKKKKKKIKKVAKIGNPKKQGY